VTQTAPYNEKELLLRVSTGDESAFAVLFAHHRDQLFGYLLKITKSRDMAEEIVSDVFLKLWVGRELLVNIENLGGFLHKVAHNKAMDFFKTTARQARLQQQYALRLDRLGDKDSFEVLEEQECRRIVLEAVNQLPPQRQLIYKMSREQGLTHEQIATALNLSRHTIKNAIIAANRSISEHLQQFYPGDTALFCLFFCT